jgi:CBS domain-containing protein
MKIAVKDVMTSRVVWVTKDAPYKEMAAALRENRVSAFPVLDDEGKVTSDFPLSTTAALWSGLSAGPTCWRSTTGPMMKSGGKSSAT